MEQDINVLEEYKEFCKNEGMIGFLVNDKVTSWDDTTLFCPAGMQI